MENFVLAEDPVLSISGGYKPIMSILSTSSTFLGRLHKHFKMCTPYMFPVTFYDKGKGGFGFLLSKRDPHVERFLRDIHHIDGKEVQIGRILFVSGLPMDTASEDLKEFFSKFGEVEEFELAAKGFTGDRVSDFGLVVFKHSNIVNELAFKCTIPFVGGKMVVCRKAMILSLDKVSLGASAPMVNPSTQPYSTRPGTPGLAGGSAMEMFGPSMLLKGAGIYRQINAHGDVSDRKFLDNVRNEDFRRLGRPGFPLLNSKLYRTKGF